jgi:4-diphosphocytidyl-2-C-methyl-D-erythritol kinase
VPTDERNILSKAYNLLKKDVPFGLKIKLKKNIPIGAGLGGGSSNAAALINFLNVKANLGLSPQKLIQLGKKIGADVPFFLSQNSTALVRGIGEKITPLERSPYKYFLLINPNLHIGTKEVYQAFDKTPAAQKSPSKTPKNFLKAHFGQNDLKPVVFNHYPALKKLAADLESLGVGQIFMSGSGSTLFVPFKSWQEAGHWEQILKPKYPQFLIIKTKACKPQK